MRIAILGGGPAGLYFAILMKRAEPGHDITVYERNRADDTFGFGVVFSDQTLETFERYDRPSFDAITREFAYWQDIEIRHKGTVHRIGGNGFCGCARRTLLMLLQARARTLGVRLEFRHEITGLQEVADADLVIAADGINSATRERYAEHFRPTVDLRSNKFTWMGSTKPLDSFLFSFRETEWGVFIAHAYQYEAGRSTWVLETDDATWQRAGLDQMDEAAVRPLHGGGVRRGSGRPCADHEPVALAVIPDDPQRQLRDGQCRPAGRCQGHGAFLHWIRHEAGDGGCDRPLREPARQPGRARRPRPFRGDAAGGGGEDPARRRRVAGVVRASPPFLGNGPGPVRLRRDDAVQIDHLRQFAPARGRTSWPRRTGCSPGASLPPGST